MRLLVVLSLMLLLVVSPAYADLEPDEGGCQSWGTNLAAGEPFSSWVAIVAHPDSIGDTSGFWVIDPNEGDEYLEVELDFGSEEVVWRVELVWELPVVYQPDDALELRLSASTPVERWEPLSEFKTDDLTTTIWEGSIVANSISVYLRSNSDDISRGILHDVKICINQPPEVEAALWLLIQSTSEPLIGMIAVFVALITVAALIGAAMAVLT